MIKIPMVAGGFVLKIHSLLFSTVFLVGCTTTVFSIQSESNNSIRQPAQASPLVHDLRIETLAGSTGGSGAADGIGRNAHFRNPMGVVAVGDGLYVADRDNNIIRRVAIATGEVTTFAGSPFDSGQKDGTGVGARFKWPSGITSDGTHLYIADTGNNLIRKIEIATAQVTTFAGRGFSTFKGDGPDYFNAPVGITIAGENLYVADTDNNRIRKIEMATNSVTTLAGNGSDHFFDRVPYPDYTNIDGIGTQAMIAHPRGIATDGKFVYIADTNNQVIRSIDIASGKVSTLAGQVKIVGRTDGKTYAVGFSSPDSIVVSEGNIFITDFGNNLIRKLSLKTGEVTTLAGDSYYNTGADNAQQVDGQGRAARFSGPMGIALSGSNLFVVDSNNTSVRKVSIATSEVSTIAGLTGYNGYANGRGDEVKFNYPSGMVADESSIYVVDSGNGLIRQIALATGEVTTLAGSYPSRGFTDGRGSAASFGLLKSVAIVGHDLYVTEFESNTIRKIEIATGLVSTFAGYPGMAGHDDGKGTAARFKNPDGIATDGANLYVADTGNRSIRKIVIATREVTTFAGIPSNQAGIYRRPTKLTINGNYLYILNHEDETNSKKNNAIYRVPLDLGGIAAIFLEHVGSPNSPSGITTDETNLYVADYSGNKIYKIDLATKAITPLTQNESYVEQADGPISNARILRPLGILYSSGGLYFTQDYSVRLIH